MTIRRAGGLYIMGVVTLVGMVTLLIVNWRRLAPLAPGTQWQIYQLVWRNPQAAIIVIINN